MGEGVCKQWLSRIMVGFWNKCALLGNVLVYLIAGNSYSGVRMRGPKSRSMLRPKTRSQRLFPSRARPVPAGLLTMLCGVVGGGFPWRSLFLQRRSRPIFGAILRTNFGTYGVFRGPFLRIHFWNHGFGSLNTRP